MKMYKIGPKMSKISPKTFKSVQKCLKSVQKSVKISEKYLITIQNPTHDKKCGIYLQDPSAGL